MSNVSRKGSETADVTEPAVVVVWDPDILSEEDYADLVKAIGDVVRSHGGIGIKLLRPNTFEAFVEEGVPA